MLSQQVMRSSFLAAQGRYGNCPGVVEDFEQLKVLNLYCPLDTDDLNVVWN